jgi:hypothetical protein
MVAHVPKRIKEFVPSDILDDGPQFVLSVSAGSLFGAWVTAKGHSIRWLSGWPLGFSSAIAISSVAWVWRSRVTDRRDKEKDERQQIAFNKIDESHEATIETRDMMRVLLKATSASGVAEPTTTEYVNPGFAAANVTTKASVKFGGMQIEAREKDLEKEGGMGA